MLLGCQIALVDALIPVLRFQPASLPTLIEFIFGAIEFRMAEDAADNGGWMKTNIPEIKTTKNNSLRLGLQQIIGHRL